MRRSSRKSIKTPVNYAKINSDDEEGDFEDSGSEASVPEQDSEEDEDDSADDFVSVEDSCKKNDRKNIRQPQTKKRQLIMENKHAGEESKPFTVKDLTEKQKLLPEFLNLSESGSDSDENDDSAKKYGPSTSFFHNVDINNEGIFGTDVEKTNTKFEDKVERLSDSDSDMETEDQSKNTMQTISKTSDKPVNKINFQHLHEHTKKLQDVKESFELYNKKHSKVNEQALDVGTLLAMGEEETVNKNNVAKEEADITDSDNEDWEEVKVDTKTRTSIPKSGIQVIIQASSHTSKDKKKPIDIEMMLKRRINRVKKEYQIYMHKVHVLSWIAHGNYINSVLNDANLMSRALNLIPSKKSYPENRINIKYLEQITRWYSEFLVVKEDKEEFKYRANKPTLMASLLQQIKTKIASTNKNKVLIFICILRALGIKCRLILSFKVVPLRPPSTELCSLSTKKNDSKKETSKHFKNEMSNEKSNKSNENSKGVSKCSKKSTKKTKYESSDEIIQLDGADDIIPKNKSNKKSVKIKKAENKKVKVDESKSVSYWDSITKETIDQKSDSKRINHRDLHNSTNSKCSENMAVTSMNNVLSKSSLNIKNNDVQLQDEKGNKNAKNNTSKFFKNSSCDDENMASATNSKTIKGKFKVKINSMKNKQTENGKKQKDDTTSQNKNKSQNKKQGSKTDTVQSLKQESSGNKMCVSKMKNSSNKRDAKNNSEDSEDRSKYFESSDDKKTIKTQINLSLNRRRRIKRIKSNSSNFSDEMDISNGENWNSDADKKITPKRKRRDSNKSDADFKPVKKRSFVHDKIDRRVLSTDDEQTNDKQRKRMIDFWCEVYVEEEDHWISVDVIKAQIHCVNELYNRSSHPVTYIVSWDNVGYVKDITKRYVPHWNTTTRKLRTDVDWYNTALCPWMAPEQTRDKKEDEELNRLELDAPLPKTISEYKNHPLYALKRHLLKFEVIYPADAMVLGFVNKEPVYARECVYVCRSRETWVKEAKVVRPGEKPYKIVKARPKYDRLSGKTITDIPLEIFGPWQVDDYVPPKAENGKVPRNPYGNVELFKPCMLPEGTVHIVLPGLNKVAKKIGIDCAPAMIGFDYHSGGSHPMYDGFVICEEFKDQIVEAWEQDRIEAEQRAREKVESRVYGNWKKLIRGLLIRERLKAKYDFQSESQNSRAKKCSQPFGHSSKKSKS